MSELMQHAPFIAVALLLTIGIGGLMFKRNLIKLLMAVTVIEAAVNLFLVSLGYRTEGIAPIFTGAKSTHMVLPTLQALTLTAIVIGLASTAMMLSFAVIIYRKYGTTNIEKIRELKG